MDVLDGLAALVTKSLVERVEQGGGTRYRLLEMIRQYAAEHLETSGDSTDARDLHAHHYLAFATEGLARVHTPAAWDALDELDRDAANIAAAGRWLLDTGRAGELLDFFAGLPFTETTEYSGPLLDAVGRIAEATVTDPSITPEGADYACLLAADRHMMGGDMQEFRRFCRLATNRAGPPTGQQLMMESSVALFDGDVEEAIVLAGRAVELARQSTPAELSYGLALLSICERVAESDSAARHAAEAVTVARTTGSPATLLYPLFAFANAVHVTDPEQAIAAAEECIELDRSQTKTWTDGEPDDHGPSPPRTRRHGTRTPRHARRDPPPRPRRGPPHPVIDVAVLADAIASLAPLDAVQLVAIAESDAIAALDSIRKFDPTAVLLERYPDELAEARQAAATMSYDNATSFVLDALDRHNARSETPDRKA